MEPVPFPALVPTARSYKPGVFAEEIFTAQNGAVTRLRFGNRLFNSSLSLTFANISDDAAASILENYYRVMRGDYRAVFTTADVAAGTTPNLAQWYLEIPTGLKWKYRGPPQVQSVRPGLSTVSCEFIGEMEGA